MSQATISMETLILPMDLVLVKYLTERQKPILAPVVAMSTLVSAAQVMWQYFLRLVNM